MRFSVVHLADSVPLAAAERQKSLHSLLSCLRTACTFTMDGGTLALQSQAGQLPQGGRRPVPQQHRPHQHRSTGILFLITCALTELAQRGRAAPASGSLTGFLAMGSFPCCPLGVCQGMGSRLLMGSVAHLHYLAMTITYFI